MEKSFQELANKYIFPGNVEINDENKIIQVLIKGEEKPVTDFQNDPRAKALSDLGLLLRRINVYNMYIKSFNKCQNIEDEAVTNCMSINTGFEEITRQSNRKQDGPCSHIFEFFESIESLDKNLIKKQKIRALIGEVHEYVTKIKLNKKGGKFKSNKKRKTNKRKKTKRRKTKTNKRRKTKSKTNKRKKRTRRRR